ncbi:MAG TPA: thioesterase family protein [Mycobacteriales bacterium]|nr:thioesterase family protein [Mycobacteriales bacterium]
MIRHQYECPMRWSDMDAQGHINNSAFVIYLEQARIDLFFTRAGDAGIGTIAEGVVVARHEIDYRRPVPYGPRPLRIDLWCSQISGASFTVAYEIFDGEQLAAQARTVCVPYDLAHGRVRRLSPDERSFIERYLEQAAGEPAVS